MKIPCPVPGCERVIGNPSALKKHIQEIHDKSPTQALEIIAGGAAAPLEEKPAAEPAPELQESPDTVAELQERLTAAEAKTMDDFTPVEKGKFFMGLSKTLTLEDKAILASKIGIPLAAATDAEVAEAEGGPAIIKGKTDKPGYRYLGYLDRSIRE